MCDMISPFDLTASEAFAKGNVGDCIEHVNGEKFDITVNGTIILAHLDVNKKAFRVFHAPFEDLPQVKWTHGFDLPKNAINAKIQYNCGVEIELPSQVRSITYEIPNE